MQLFKGDPTELKFLNSAGPVIDDLLADKVSFLDQAYSSQKLGEAIFNIAGDPIAEAMALSVYKVVFSSIHLLADKPATFESWIELFSNIYLASGAIRFVVPAAGKLEINIDGYVMKQFLFGLEDGDTIVDENGDELIFNSLVPTIAITNFDFLAPEVVNSVITNHLVIDESGDNIQFKGYDPVLTQADATKFIYQISAGGIYTTVSLNLI